jgi:putative protein-disulfide isomerase
MSRSTPVRLIYFLIATIILASFTPETTSEKSFPVTHSEKPELIYVYDPLCSWCFGFTPVINQIHAKYSGAVNFTILTGGLVLNREGEPATGSEELIRQMMEQIENSTGVKAGEPFFNLMKSGTYVYNSEIPCLAHFIAKEIQPDSGFAFSKALQEMFFINGKNLNDTAVYLSAVDSFGIDKTLFLEHFRNPVYRDKIYKEFSDVSGMGVESFPALVLKKGGKTEVLTSGYITFEKLDRLIAKRLRK